MRHCFVHLLMMTFFALITARCSRANDAHSLMATPPPPADAAAGALDLPAPPTLAFALDKVGWKPPRLVISEMLVDPLMMEDSAGEFIELVNLSSEPIRLSDLSLLLPSGKSVVPERPRAPVIRAGEIVLLTPQAYANGEARVRGLKLPNQAGRLELRWRKTLVDVVQWHRKKPWPKARPGVALERTAPDADGTLGVSWRRSVTPQHAVERASPGHLTWSCQQLRNTAAYTACLADREAELAKLAAQKRKSRAILCSAPATSAASAARKSPAKARRKVAEGGLEPST